MENSNKGRSFAITLPNSIYKRVVDSFKAEGTTFEDTIASDPRHAYEIFRTTLPEAMLIGRTTLVASQKGIAVDRHLDGETAFEAVATTELSLALMDPLPTSEAEVVIRVMCGPSVVDTILRHHKDPKLKKEVRFTVPALD